MAQIYLKQNICAYLELNCINVTFKTQDQVVSVADSLNIKIVSRNETKINMRILIFKIEITSFTVIIHMIV